MIHRSEISIQIKTVMEWSIRVVINDTCRLITSILSRADVNHNSKRGIDESIPRYSFCAGLVYGDVGRHRALHTLRVGPFRAFPYNISGTDSQPVFTRLKEGFTDANVKSDIYPPLLFKEELVAILVELRVVHLLLQYARRKGPFLFEEIKRSHNL